MSSWKDHEIRRKSYLNIACVSRRLEVVGARKNGTREGDTREERKRVPKRPLASPVFLEPKYFQAPATLATSTKLTLWVVCLGHSNLSPYLLVGPVGMDTQNTDPAASENRFDGSSPRFITPDTPLYTLYSTGICRWTGYGFWPLCPKQDGLLTGYIILCVYQQGISCTIDLIC